MRTSASIIATLLISLTSTAAQGWGERGHNAIARVASRLIAQNQDPDTAAFGTVLQKHEHMLGHLANVPDIVWRSASPEVVEANAPTHFIDLDYILPATNKLTLQDCPSDVDSYRKAILANCSKKDLRCAPGESETAKLSKAGHAPFRIQSLSRDLTILFSEIKKLEREPKVKSDVRTALIDQAMLYAGVIAHFVGDLSNPHHTTSDYDGWQTGQGGLHSYFEAEQVDAQDLNLEHAIYTVALKQQPAKALFVNDAKDSLKIAWQLALDSHERLPALRELDQKYSLLKKSVKAPRTKAQRKPSAAVASAYHDFLLERLSLGADALALVWISAWQAAGKPRLENYENRNYPVKPEFISVEYIAPRVARQDTAKTKL